MPHHISFGTLPWQSAATGQRCKAVVHEGRQLRLMEVTPEFVEPDWCAKGHIGYVLDGILELEFEDETLLYHPGDGYVIPAGKADHHKARALTPVVSVIMFEDV